MNKLIVGMILITGLAFGIGIMQLGLLNIKPPSVEQVTVKVIYFNSWIGSINSNGVTQSIQGTGDSEIVLDRPKNVKYWDISVSAQKLDGSNEILSVQIIGKGEIILMDKGTKNPNGVVAFSVKYQ